MKREIKAKEQAGSATYRLKAVVDIGSTSIRMAVAQIHAAGVFKVLDELSQSAAVGRDVFTTGRISRGTTELCVQVLRSFAKVTAEYGMDLRRDVRAVATSAVREAANREVFLDRLCMASGIRAEVIEGTEINRLTYLALKPLLVAESGLRSGPLLALEIGGGSVELLELQDGTVCSAHSFKVGSYRLREALDQQLPAEERRLEVLRMETMAAVRGMKAALPGMAKGLKLLLMGGEARFAADHLVGRLEPGTTVEVKLAELDRLAEETAGLEPGRLKRQYHLALEEAQTLGPALLMYAQTARLFGVRKMRVCTVTLRDGLLAEAAAENPWDDDFMRQILHSVRETGARYRRDEAHAECVAETVRALFRALAEEHRLDSRFEVILAVAAQLHDIGMFVSAGGHHKHSAYLIANSEIFGLSRDDIRLAALTARYHRKALPQVSHPEYTALPREKRVAVSQMAALLRVADALDRSHTQAVRGFRLRVRPDRVVFEVSGPSGFAAEKRALAEKGGLFEDIFGRPVVLVQRKGKG